MIKIKNYILTIIFTVLLTTTIIYTSISNSITTTSLKTTSKNLVKSGLIYNDDKTYTDIFNTILKLTPLTEQQALDMMNLDYVEEILTDIVDTIYEYNLTGDESVKYTKKQIITLVEDYIVRITTDINYPLSENDKNEAINYTKENTDYIIDTIYQTNIGNWKSENQWLILEKYLIPTITLYL